MESSAGSTYPDLASPTDSVIAGDFGTLNADEQERQRNEWKDELAKTEEEILTLKQVLSSKERHAQGLKRRLGITQWREFSEDMTQGLKNIQESQAYRRTAETLSEAGKKTSGWVTAVATSAAVTNFSERVGFAFGAAKSKMSASLSQQNLGSVLSPSSAATANAHANAPGATNGGGLADASSAIPEEPK